MQYDSGDNPEDCRYRVEDYAGKRQHGVGTIVLSYTVYFGRSGSKAELILIEN